MRNLALIVHMMEMIDLRLRRMGTIKLWIVPLEVWIVHQITLSYVRVIRMMNAQNRAIHLLWTHRVVKLWWWLLFLKIEQLIKTHEWFFRILSSKTSAYVCPISEIFRGEVVLLNEILIEIHFWRLDLVLNIWLLN